MSIEDNSVEDLSVYGNISVKSTEKRITAKQIVEETKVCGYLRRITDDTNVVLARADQCIRLALVMDESNNAPAAVEFDAGTKRFVRRNVDPIAISDFIEPVRKKVEFANKKMLYSFKLRIAIEPPAAGERGA
jgi:hypothetical protein